MLTWLRRTFITGFFVTVPLAVSLIALVWAFRLVDGASAGLSERLFHVHVPGLGIAAAMLVLLGVGMLARNVVGRRLLARGEHLLLHVPVFRTVYQPIKQLMAAFSPDNEYGFKHVVMVDDAHRGMVLGFMTKEFTVDLKDGTREEMVAVYVPTNHLYLGDITICRKDRVTFPSLTVEEGIRIFLTGGMALPDGVRTEHKHD